MVVDLYSERIFICHKIGVNYSHETINHHYYYSLCQDKHMQCDFSKLKNKHSNIVPRN